MKGSGDFTEGFGFSGAYKWVEIAHALWHCCFMKQIVPIWFCKQVQIYCKYFFNHGWSRQRSSQHHMLIAHMSVFAKSICFLTNVVSIKFSLVTLLYILSTTWSTWCILLLRAVVCAQLVAPGAVTADLFLFRVARRGHTGDCSSPWELWHIQTVILSRGDWQD